VGAYSTPRSISLAIGYGVNVDADAPLRLFAATSGWEGPFQHEQVLVAAVDPEDARRRAEVAFGEVVQPVCRAKMRIADLGPLSEGLVVGPLRAGDSLADGGHEVDLRCGAEPPA
jgi:hypothetical protein